MMRAEGAYYCEKVNCVMNLSVVLGQNSSMIT